MRFAAIPAPIAPRPMNPTRAFCIECPVPFVCGGPPGSETFRRCPGIIPPRLLQLTVAGMLCIAAGVVNPSGVVIKTVQAPAATGWNSVVTQP